MADTFQDYLGALKSIYGVAASVGLIIPCAAFFANLAPPLLPGCFVLVDALAAATLLSMYHYSPRRPSRKRTALPPRVRIALWAFCGATLLLVIYVGFLSFFTVQEGGERFQIGFYKATWSLTAEGMRVKRVHPLSTPREWMMNDALFDDDGPSKLWKQWSRYLTFSLMFVVLSGAFMLWTAGWGLLAKEHRAADGG